MYAPVANFMLCLITLIISFVSSWHMKHVDVSAAFLNGDIDRELHVPFPYNIQKYFQSEKLYQLHKALYGLKHSPLLWFQKLKKELTVEMGYKPLKSNCYIFVDQRGGAVSLILTNADDLIFISSDESVQGSSIHKFLSIFEGTAKLLNWYLSVHIFTPEALMRLSQAA